MSTMGWPKLSLTLPGLFRTEFGTCQRCGTEGELHEELLVWQEHDERDRPTPVAVVLCERCSEIIEPHPRLYSQLRPHVPLPGVMELCRGCRFRSGYLCEHPDLSVNGGSGLKIEFPSPMRAHVDGRDRRGRRFGRFETWWTGPPTSCAGREVAEQAGEA